MLKKELTQLKPPAKESTQPHKSTTPCPERTPQATPASTSPPEYRPEPHIQNVRKTKKFNIVIYGVQEHPKGTKHHERLAKDISNTSRILNSLSSALSDQSICDCTRLGKFNPEGDKPRPILVNLMRASDVTSVLSNRSKLSRMPNISIKAFMTPTERAIESILLRECRSLISNGTERKSIRIKGNCILVHNEPYGRVIDNIFLLHPVNSGEDEANPNPYCLPASLSPHQPDPQTNSNQLQEARHPDQRQPTATSNQ